MSDTAEDSEGMLAHAQQLVEYLRKNDQENVNHVLDQLTGMRESDLYQEVGKITRELHQALSGFQIDGRIKELANSEMPSATERLTYVIEVTEASANTTLQAVEDTVPLSERIEERGKELQIEWKRFQGRKMTVNEFKQMSGKIESYLNDTTEDSILLQQKLNEVLMAQGFQDITGQIIRHVITLVQEVEDNMVNLIRASGHTETVDEMAEMMIDATSEVAELDGPVVPGVNDDDGKVSGQDEVDDLLSSLGF